MYTLALHVLRFINLSNRYQESSREHYVLAGADPRDVQDTSTSERFEDWRIERYYAVAHGAVSSDPRS